MNNHQSHNLWLFLELLGKKRGLIFTTVILITLAALVVSLVLPKWYKATALLLPPKDVSVQIAGLNQISDAVSVTSGLNLPVLATTADIYVRMLKSRTITSRIINRFDLKTRYGARNFEEAYLNLIYLSDLQVTDEGLLIVSVEDKDPQIAADITNAFIDELDKVNQEIVAERIKQTRVFIEERLNQVKKELDSTRQELEAFQMKYKTVDFDKQTGLAIEQATKLKITLAEINLSLKMSEMKLGKDNPELIELKQREDIVKKQLQILENQNIDNSFFSLPVASIPALKGQYEILYSRVKVANALYHLLLEQQEKAKIKEYEKMPTISVLDRAKPPELKSRPQRTIIVVSAFGISIIFSILLAALLEYFHKLKDSHPDDYNRAMIFFTAFFGWLPGVRKKG